MISLFSDIKCNVLFGASVLLFIWAFFILFLNIGSFTADAVYQANYSYPGGLGINKDYSGIVINFEYRAKGAFIAGKKNPVNINVKIIPIGKPTFFEEIKNKDKLFKIKFSGARDYSEKINPYLKIPESASIDNFNFDGENLKGKVKLYYLAGGEFLPMIHYGTETKSDHHAVEMKGQALKIASQEVSLQLINNNRILALTLAIIALTLIQISRRFS